jgi:hypothetical protein
VLVVLLVDVDVEELEEVDVLLEVSMVLVDELVVLDVDVVELVEVVLVVTVSGTEVLTSTDVLVELLVLVEVVELDEVDDVEDVEVVDDVDVVDDEVDEVLVVVVVPKVHSGPSRQTSSTSWPAFVAIVTPAGMTPVGTLPAKVTEKIPPVFEPSSQVASQNGTPLPVSNLKPSRQVVGSGLTIVLEPPEESTIAFRSVSHNPSTQWLRFGASCNRQMM